MKKIISLILAFGMIITSFEMAAAVEFNDISGEKLTEAVDFLSTLGIINGYDDDTFRPDSLITRAEFAVILARTMNLNEQSDNDKHYYYDVPSNHWATGAINQLTKLGIISGYGDNKFGLDDHILVQDTYKMLLSVCGYDQYAQMNGGYPNGYISAAFSSELANGVNAAASDEVTRGQVAMLVYNALSIDTYTQDYAGSYKISDTNLLYLYRRLTKIEGTVTAVSGTTFYDENSYQNTICINNEYYNISNVQVSDDMLGKYVVAYCDDEEEPANIVYIHISDNKTDEIEIAAEDIASVSDDYKISYYKGNSRKQINIDSKARVIYNGTAYPNYTKEDFEIDYGSIRLLKTKSSSYYDLVFINSYYDVFVSSIDVSNEIIYGSSGEKLNLKDDFDDVTIQDQEGKEQSISNIQIDDVLCIRQAGDARIEITICRQSVTGVIKSLSHNDSYVDVKINEDEYKVYKSYGDTFEGSFSSGSEITAYLDIFNNIVYAKTSEISRDPIGYIKNAWIDESDSDVAVKIFTYEGEMKEIYLARKVKIDGQSCSTTESKLNMLSENGVPKPQLVVYKLNSKGEITYIDTIKQTPEENEYNLSISMPMYSYRVKENGALGGKGYIKGTTNMICIPDDEDIRKSSDSDFSIKPASSIMSNVYRNLETYKLAPKIGYENIVVMKGGRSEGISEFTQCIIVEDMFTTIDEDDEQTVGIEAVSPSGNTELIFDAKYKYLADDLQEGDLIRVGVNGKGFIDTMEVVIKKGTNPVMGTGSFHDSINSIDINQKYTYGYAVHKEGSIVRIGYNNDGTWDEAANITNVIIYDTETDKISFGNVNDILTYESAGGSCDRIFVHWKYSEIMGCVIYK